jgi:hypothetical protein
MWPLNVYTRVDEIMLFVLRVVIVLKMHVSVSCCVLRDVSGCCKAYFVQIGPMQATGI